MRKLFVHRVLRGGSYRSDWRLRTTNRDWGGPEIRNGNLGFRIVVIRRKVP